VMLVPPQHRTRAKEVFDALDVTLHWWLIGRIVSMLIIGVCTSIGLWALDVPLPIALGMFAALLTFIPNIGPIISVILAILLTLQDGGMKVVYVVILYAVLQAVESYLVTPMMQRQMIAMPPALIIASQILLGVFSGVLGILLATPLIAALVV